MNQSLSFTYKNYRGEVATRAVIPQTVWYGLSPFHDDKPQWFLKAYDLDKQAFRDFAMADITDIQR